MSMTCRSNVQIQQNLVKLNLQKYSKSIGDASNALEELLDRPVERVQEYIDLLKVSLLYSYNYVIT